MAQGTPIAVVDGCNQFNVHLLSSFARERRLDPEEFLRRIFISRGFTCYQMEQAVSARLPLFLQSICSNIAMIFGLLDTFYDEQAPLREVRQILVRVLATLHELKQTGVSLLLACTDRQVLPEERNILFTTVKAHADRVYRLDVRPEVSRLILEQEEHSTPIIHRSGNEVPPAKGGDRYGTYRTDLHEYHRQRTRKLVEVPAGTPPGRPGVVR